MTTLDFAIEGTALADSAAIIRRDQALKALKLANPNLTISYTLPALQSGLTAAEVALLNQAKTDGLPLNVLNILVMDFGPGVSNMAVAATEAAAAVENGGCAGATQASCCVQRNLPSDLCLLGCLQSSALRKRSWGKLD